MNTNKLSIVPVWDETAEAMLHLNSIESLLGGANGPTIRLRAILGKRATLEAVQAQSVYIKELEVVSRRLAMDREDALHPSNDVILDALHEYHCTETHDDDGNGSKLVDVFTTHGNDIRPGITEIEALADFIWGALADTTPKKPALMNKCR